MAPAGADRGLRVKGGRPGLVPDGRRGGRRGGRHGEPPRGGRGQQRPCLVKTRARGRSTASGRRRYWIGGEWYSFQRVTSRGCRLGRGRGTGSRWGRPAATAQPGGGAPRVCGGASGWTSPLGLARDRVARAKRKTCQGVRTCDWSHMVFMASVSCGRAPTPPHSGLFATTAQRAARSSMQSTAVERWC